MEKYAMIIVGLVAAVGIFAIAGTILLLNTDGNTRGFALAPSEVSRTCYDSDGRNNWYTSGYVTMSGVSYNDYCSGSTVYDFYCFNVVDADKSAATANVVRPSPDPQAPSSAFSCPYGCCNGACLSNQSSCTDTDGGFNYGIRGSLSGWISACPANNSYAYNITEQCLNANTLREYYCITPTNGSYPYNYYDVNCQYGCSNGACLSNQSNQTNTTNPSCSDTDYGLHLYSYGVTSGTYANGASFNIPDRCYNTYYINESWCVNMSTRGPPEVRSYDCRAYGYDVCLNGYCQNVNNGSNQTNQTNTTQVCGNGVREGTEWCDGADLNGYSCIYMGFTGGTLACNNACNGFITTGCLNNTNQTNSSCAGKPNGYACDDGLYCTVNDVCSNNVCVGSARSCTANNVNVNTCTFVPDSISTTLDTYSFTSVCNEASDSCTTAPTNWTTQITHTCNVATCGAQCQTNANCANYCAGNTFYYGGSCTSGCTCNYVSQYCPYGCSVNGCYGGNQTNGTEVIV